MFKYGIFFVITLILSYSNNRVSSDYIYIKDGDYATYFEEMTKKPLTENEYNELKKREAKEIERLTSDEAIKKSSMYFFSIYAGMAFIFCIIYYLLVAFFIKPTKKIEQLIIPTIVFLGSGFFLSLSESVLYAIITIISNVLYRKRIS